MVINRMLTMGIVVSLSVAGTSLYHYLQERSAGRSIVSCSLPTGDFTVISRDGHLQTLDQKTGAEAGLLERWPDGDIQLTTTEGFAPDVTQCLSGKLDAEQLNSLPLHG